MVVRGLPRLAGFGLAWVVLSSQGIASAAPKLDFNRDVRPILSDNCYACHGPDKNKRKADLRLDTREGLFAEHDGVRNLVAGDAEESELFRRITTDDEGERMPDPKSGKRLSPAQIATIKAWIEQGAEWKGHWSYLPPERPKVPDEAGSSRNPIDRFVRAELDEAGLSPSPEADRVTLIRRLSFDLIGLPPTKAEVDAFVADRGADAYEKVVDRLLASPHYGERMAISWLDLVRYADTIGYHSDNPMPVFPYRDYVIRSFNDNTPFDRFTIEQLAGDLLPDAGTSQKVASGYNRLLQTTEEGGAQAKEYEAKYAADRVRNVSTVWLGATLGCAQCHDHKFDPYSTKDFYRFAAFFADVQEAAVGKREPGLPVPDDRRAAEIMRLDETIAGLNKRLESTTPELAAARADWESKQGTEGDWTVLTPESATVAGESHLRIDEGGLLVDFGKVAARETYTVVARTDLKGITGFRVEAMADKELPAGGPGTAPNGNFVLTEFRVSADSKPVPLREPVADFEQGGFPVALAIDGKDETGWAIDPETGKAHVATFEAADPVVVEGGPRLTFTLDFHSPFPQHQFGKFRIAVSTSPKPSARSLPADVRAALAVSPDRRSGPEKDRIASYYRSIAPLLKPVRDEIAALQREKDAVLAGLPKTLVTTSGPPRSTRILPRGNWQDETGEVVTPAVPHFLPQLPDSGTRATRLELARWLVARENPLTARVFSNRLWKLFFGQGLTKTLDDLGSQGEWPTHPELLDWLAVEFMESGWDVKRVVRSIVTSATYRQSSHPTAELKERDPYNRLLARQGRFRLDAEIVRDNALAIGGLLSERVGGPSVKPYQPAGYWDQLNFPTRTYEPDRGEDQYRRGLYTHWQRSFLHPSLQAFDAPTREECAVERARSNIPQQALVLLNDPTYVESARAFAEHILKEAGPGADARLDWAFSRSLSRAPSAEERPILTDLLAKHRERYRSDPVAAKKLISIGQRPAPTDLDPGELAAWTSVARVILNLHETITRD